MQEKRDTTRERLAVLLHVRPCEEEKFEKKKEERGRKADRRKKCTKNANLKRNRNCHLGSLGTGWSKYNITMDHKGNLIDDPIISHTMYPQLTVTR